MAEVAGKGGQLLKVFISYSRADAAFADELVAGLEFEGSFAVTIDRHSIIEGEEWQARLGALIADADTIVFLLSPDSARSEVCRWEVDHAYGLAKRIIPVLVRQLGGERAPEKLAALNYVRFDEDRSFMAGLKGLDRALKADLEWLREHTRLLARALEWEAGGWMANRLLSGADVAAAKAWAARRPATAPELTPLHLDYIRASEENERAEAEAARLQVEERERLAREKWEAAEKAEEQARIAQQAALQAQIAQKERGQALEQAAQEQRRRLRFRNAVVGAVVISLGAVLLGWQVLDNLWRAEREAQRDQQQRDELFRARSRTTAELARALTERGDAGTAMNLILEELEPDPKDPGPRPLVDETHFTLFGALHSNLEQSILPAGGEARIVAYSARGQILAAAERNVLVYDAGAPIPRHRLTHGGAVTAAAFSRDGLKVLSASRDRKARLWSLESGQASELEHGDEVRVAVFDPEERLVATGANDDTAVIWDAASGERRHTLRHDSDVMDVAWLDGSKRLLTVTQGGILRAWDAASGNMLLEVSAGANTRPTRVVVNRDGTRAATRAIRGPAVLWDTKDLSVVATLAHERSSITRVAFSPTDDLVATSGDDQRVVVWETRKGVPIYPLLDHLDLASGVAFSPDGSRLLSWSPDRTARVYAACDGRRLATLYGHTQEVVSAGFSADGCSVVTGSGDATARTWDLVERPGQTVLAEQRCTPGLGRRSSDRCQAQVQFAGLKRELLDATFSKDSKWVAAGANDGIVRVFDARAARLAAALPAQPQPARAVAFDATGRVLLAGHGSLLADQGPGVLRVWDWQEKRELVAGGIAHSGAVRSVSASPDGTRILTASADGLAQIFDAGTGALILRLETEADNICGQKPCRLNGAAWSPDGRRVATASYGHKACVWDTVDKTGILRTPTLCVQHDQIVYSVSWSSRGTHIVTASGDQKAVVWDARSGQAVRYIYGDAFDFRSAEFFDGDQQLVTSHDDYSIRFWRVGSGRETLRLPHLQAHVLSAKIDASGLLLLAAAADGTARLWHMAGTLKHLAASARTTLNRCLSSEQRVQFNLSERPLPHWCTGKLYGPRP